MSPAQQNFKACIENLEKLNTEYIQANKSILESRSLTQISVTHSVSNTTIVSQTTSTSSLVVMSDYLRLYRMYCIMLWTYWEALGIFSDKLDELRLVRNCLVHHDGDMFKYSNSSRAVEGELLIQISMGKSYVNGYSIIFSESDIAYFTDLLKIEFKAHAGIDL